jgi:hypothetical protein
MWSASFNQIKTLCIVFPGAAGGHHLANLISCCDEFDQKISPKEMLDLYLKRDAEIDRLIKKVNKQSIQELKAHFFDQNHYFVGKIQAPGYPAVSDKIDIIAGHTHLYHENQTILEKIPSPAWIMMSWAKDDSLPGIRRIKMGSGKQLVATYDWPNTYIKHSRSPCDENGFCLNTEKFWDINGTDYFRELLINNFGIELPKIADEIHAIWWKWMLKAINAKIL